MLSSFLKLMKALWCFELLVYVSVFMMTVLFLFLIFFFISAAIDHYHCHCLLSTTIDYWLLTIEPSGHNWVPLLTTLEAGRQCEPVATRIRLSIGQFVCKVCHYRVHQKNKQKSRREMKTDRLEGSNSGLHCQLFKLSAATKRFCKQNNKKEAPGQSALVMSKSNSVQLRSACAVWLDNDAWPRPTMTECWTTVVDAKIRWSCGKKEERERERESEEYKGSNVGDVGVDYCCCCRLLVGRTSS